MKNILMACFGILLFFHLPGYSQFDQLQSVDTSFYNDSLDKCGFDSTVNERMIQLYGDDWGYGYNDLLSDLEQWQQSAYVSVDSIGHSIQNRAIWRFIITSNDPTDFSERRTVFIHARTHPNEVQSFWVTEEIINLLIAEDSFSKFMRKNCVFYIIPMYNPDGVELGYPRENANGIDLEREWDKESMQPEALALKHQFETLMNSSQPIEIALNMHSSTLCKRYFYYHDAAGTSVDFTQLEQNFIGGVRSYFMNGIEPWNFKVSWTNGTPPYYPESWFWLNFGEEVMALTYEDMNCSAAGDYDSTAYALVHGIADYLGLAQTGIKEQIAANQALSLSQNYPNPVQLSGPSGSTTTIQYSLNRPKKVQLTLYNVLGQKIKVLQNGIKAVGTHDVSFDATNLSNGIYFYKLETATESRFRKLMIIR